MTSLCLKPNGPFHFDLVIRTHDLGGTEYHVIKTVTDSLAELIVRSGEPYWLYGEPDWEARAAKQSIANADKMRREADRMEQEAKAKLEGLSGNP